MVMRICNGDKAREEFKPRARPWDGKQ